MPLAEPDYSLVDAVRGVMNERNALVAALQRIKNRDWRTMDDLEDIIDAALAALEKK